MKNNPTDKRAATKVTTVAKKVGKATAAAALAKGRLNAGGPPGGTPKVGRPKASLAFTDIVSALPAPVPSAAATNRTVVANTASALQQKMGPLLRSAVSGLASGGRATGMARAAMDTATAAEESSAESADVKMPVAISLPRIVPMAGEKWTNYKQRVADKLGPVAEWLEKNAGLRTEPSYSAGSFSTHAIVGQIEEAAKHDDVAGLELEPLRVATLMDDVVRDIELPLFRVNHSDMDGAGIRLAVLDSGIDLKHPWLKVAVSYETCGETVDIPGAHGTHVAGAIASHDAVYRGVAPGVTLINVKVLDSLGRGTSGMITRGVDKALDAGAQILSMSLGFNHLPTWSAGGHGWSCPDGRCELCRAVDNAVALDSVFVVVAAGNSHREAETLRQNGDGNTFDSEVSCPGSSVSALTVAAITKQTFLTADFSSRGPAAHGGGKPDIAAPGVNIHSAAPVPRDTSGNVLPGLTRADLNISMSGTSMATPIVAGVVALILQRRNLAGLGTTPAELRAELLTRGFRHLGRPASEIGVGRLNLAGL